MFRKASNIHLWPKRHHKTVPSRQIEIPFYRELDWQRGRGFGAREQGFGRSAIPFLRKYFIPTAKRVGAELLEIASPQIDEVESGRRNFKTVAMSCDDKLWVNSWLLVAWKRLQAKSFQQKLQSKSVVHEETFSRTILSIMWSIFWYQPNVAVSGNLGGKVPVVDNVLSSKQQVINLTASIDEN